MMATKRRSDARRLADVRFSCLLQRPGEHCKIAPYLPVVEEVLHCHLIV